VVDLVASRLLAEPGVDLEQVDDLVCRHPDARQERGDRKAGVVFEVVALLYPVQQVFHTGREQLGDDGVDLACQVQVGEAVLEVGDFRVEFVGDDVGHRQREPVDDAVLDGLLTEREQFLAGDGHLAVDERPVDQPPLVAPLIGREIQVRPDADPVAVGRLAHVAGQVELREQVGQCQPLGARALVLARRGQFVGEPLAGRRRLGAGVLAGQDALVDQRVLTRKYARAEAATARERFTDELAATSEYKSTRTERLALADLLAEFDLTGDVRETPDGYRVGVGAYLDLAADKWGDEWRLVNRTLVDGEVTVTREELLALCQQAVQHRVVDGLPLSVPDVIADELDAEVADLEDRLADLDLTREIDTVVPELFPPCMKHLLDRIQKGDHLEHHSRFAIASFLTSIGMTTDEIVDLFEVNPGFGEEATRYQVDHIRGATSPTEYSPPSCATMQSYGDCYNKDDICEDVIDESHPLNYYEHRIDEEDEDDLVDWRDDDADESSEA